MRKCVGLCIVHKNHNYGSILQSYATIMKLEELGVEYEIINYSHPHNVAFYFKAIKRLRSKDTLYSKARMIKKKIGCKVHKEYSKNDYIRGLKFEEFVNTHFLYFSKPINDYEELKSYSKKYSDVIVGSDQLWLPSGLETNFYNLMFVPESTNKIAYSSSFGVSSIPQDQKIKTKQYLERIQYISTREESGSRIVKKLTGRSVPVILDPTMIVSKTMWDTKIPDEDLIKGDYIFCYFLGNNPEHRKEVLKLSKAKKLKIVVLKHLDEYIPSDEKFGDVAPYDIGPGEFVNLIRHAKYVCTDSFHGSVFSIIYHKQFITFDRYKGGVNSRNSRIDTLFKNIGISRRLNGNIVSDIDCIVDWKEVDKKLDYLRVESSRFIYNALGMTSTNFRDDDGEKSSPITICDDHLCTGCSACAASCAKNAIQIRLDKRGFYRPVIDESKCVNCGACKRVCPINNSPLSYGPTGAFAFQNKRSVRLNSTSGGFFNAIATIVLKNGGVVCGAAFDEKMILRHTIIESVEELDSLQRSKYVQSTMSDVYKLIKTYLELGRKVLFVGVGCQVAGLKNYVGNNEGLILVDLVCYGVPSSGLFQEWINYLEKKYYKVSDVRFRDKTYGYASPNVKVIFENGKSIECCRDANMYTDLFFRHLSIRESCYECRFKSVDRCSDITLGDLWSIGNYDSHRDDNVGSTVAFAHTRKGVEICNRLCEIKLDPDRIVKTDAKKMVESIKPAKAVSGFWNKYVEDGFVSLVDLYVGNTMKNRMKYIAKKGMNLSGVSTVWYKRKKKRLFGNGRGNTK